MTKDEVLALVRETQPGEFSDERILQIVDQLDQKIYRELLDGYIVEEYGGDLVAPAPYDGLYLYWALANISLMQQDTAGYNNHMAMFNALWDEYGRMVSRTYRREKSSRYLI